MRKKHKKSSLISAALAALMIMNIMLPAASALAGSRYEISQQGKGRVSHHVEGDTLHLSAAPDEGYKFERWQSSAGQVSNAGSASGASIALQEQPIVVTAVFTEVKQPEPKQEEAPAAEREEQPAQEEAPAAEQETQPEPVAEVQQEQPAQSQQPAEPEAPQPEAQQPEAEAQPEQPEAPQPEATQTETAEQPEQPEAAQPEAPLAAEPELPAAEPQAADAPPATDDGSGAEQQAGPEEQPEEQQTAEPEPQPSAEGTEQPVGQPAAIGPQQLDYKLDIQQSGSHISTMEFSAIAGQGQPEARTAHITNTGEGGFASVEAYATDTQQAFDIDLSAIGGAMAPSANAGFTVQPRAGLAAGDYSAAIYIKAKDGQGAVVAEQSLRLLLHVAPGADKASFVLKQGNADVSSLLFNVQEGYQPAAQTVDIVNNGTQALSGISATIERGGYAFVLSGNPGGALQPGEKTTLSIQSLAGMARGEYTAVVVISANDEQGAALEPQRLEAKLNVEYADGMYGVQLSEGGTPLSAVHFVIQEGYTQAGKSIELANTGSEPLRELSVALADNQAFVLDTGALPSFELKAGAATTFGIDAVPGLAAGQYEGTILIKATDKRGLPSVDMSVPVHMLVLPVAGNGTFIVHEGAAQPDALEFEELAGYETAGARNLAVANNSAAGIARLTAAIEGDGAAAFQPAGIDAPLAAGDAAGITIQPAPGMAVGDYAATLWVWAYDEGGNETAAKSIALSLKVRDKQSGPSFVLLNSNGTQARGLEFEAASGYGQRPAAKQIAIYNNGEQDLVNLSATLSHSGNAFELGKQLPSVLAAGQKAYITIQPAGALDDGVYKGILAVSATNKSGLPAEDAKVDLAFYVGDKQVLQQYSFRLKDEAGADAALIDFRAEENVRPDARYIVLENNGSAPLTGMSATLSGEHADKFTLDSSEVADTLDTDGKAAIYIQPSAGLPNGTYTAAIVVDSAETEPKSVAVEFTVGDGQQKVYSFRLQKDGADMSALEFAEVTEGYVQPEAMEATIINDGTGELTGIAVSGATAFDITGGAAAQLEAGGQLAFSVRPKAGLGVGEHEDSLTVSATDGNGETITKTFTAKITVQPKAGESSFALTDAEGNKLGNIEFRQAVEGYEDTQQNKFTITNNGSGALEGVVAYLEGARPDAFQLKSGFGGLTLAEGEQTDYYIEVQKGLPAGSYAAQLRVKAIDTGGKVMEQSVELSYEVSPKQTKPSLSVEDGNGRVTDVDFGEAEAGYTQLPAARELTVVNDGTEPLSNVEARLGKGAGAYTLDTTGLPATLGVGETGSISIQPLPGLEADTYSGTIVISATDGGGAQIAPVNVDVEFTVERREEYYGYDIAIDGKQTGSILFSATEGYEQLPDASEITISNIGTDALADVDARLEGDDVFQLNKGGLPGGIAVQGSAKLSLQPVAGTAAGTYTANLIITAGDGKGNALESKAIALTFVVEQRQIAPSLIVRDLGGAELAAINMGARQGYTELPAKDFKVFNNGDCELRDVRLLLGGDDAAMFDLDITNIMAMPENTGTEIRLSALAGAEAGEYAAQLIVAANDERGNKLPDTAIPIQLRVDRQPELEYSYSMTVGGQQKDSLLFNGTEEAGRPNPEKIDISNTGTGGLQAVNVSLAGDDFTFDRGSLASALQPGEGGAIYVQPKDGLAAGTYTATLTVSVQDAGGKPLADKAMALVYNVSPMEDKASFILRDAGGDELSEISLAALEGYEQRPEAGLSIFNNGRGALNDVQLFLSGQHADKFVLDTYRINALAENGSAAVTVGAVDGLAEGEYTAALAVNARSAAGKTLPPLEVQLKLTVTAQSSLEYSYTMEYNGQAISAPIVFEADEGYTIRPNEAVLTIRNTGTGGIKDISIAKSGAGADMFVLGSGYPAVLAAGEQMDIRLQPAAGVPFGQYAADIVVSANGDNGEAMGQLKAAAVFRVSKAQQGNPLALLDAAGQPVARHEFAAIVQGAEADGLDIFINNTGSETLTGLAMVIEGGGKQAFTLVAGMNNSLPAGGSKAIRLGVDKATEPGTYEAVLKVSAKDGNGDAVSRELALKAVVLPRQQADSFTVTDSRGNALSKLAYTTLVEGYTNGGQQTVTISNDGDGRLGNVQAVLDGEARKAFEISGGAPAPSLDKGENTVVNIAVADGLAAGDYSGTLTLRATDSRGNALADVQVALSLKVLPQTADASMKAVDEAGNGLAAVDFGGAEAGYAQPGAKTITIVNDGNEAIQDLSAGLDKGGAAFLLDAGRLPGALQPGQSASIAVAPRQGLDVDEYTGSLSIMANDALGRPLEPLALTLKFEVKARAEVKYSYSHTVDGQAVDTASFLAVEGYTQLPQPADIGIGNTGEGRLKGVDISLDSDAAFTLDKAGMAAELAAGEQCSASIAPKAGLAAGTYNARLTITAQDADGKQLPEQTIALSFNVEQAAAQPSYALRDAQGAPLTGIALEAQEGYTQQPGQAVSIFNNGNTELTGIKAELGGADALRFEIDGATADKLAAGQAMQLTVRAKPGVPEGEYNAQLNIQAADDKGQALAGQSVPLSLKVSAGAQPVYSYDVTTGGLPANSIPFGDAIEGYLAAPEAVQVEIENTGTAPLRLEAEMDSAAAFELDTSRLAANLAAGETCALGVQPKTGLAAGSYTAELTIRAQDDEGNYLASRRITLSFNVESEQARPSFLLRDGNGSQLNSIALSAQQGYTQLPSARASMFNNGNAELSGISIKLGGDDADKFEIAEQGALAETLAKGDSLAFTVRAKAGAAEGEYNASLLMQAKNTAAVNIPLRLTVSKKAAQTYSYALMMDGRDVPQPLSFNGYEGSSYPDAKTIVIKNTGTGKLQDINVGISGAGASMYKLGAGFAKQLDAGGQTSFTLQPVEDAKEGIYYADIEVSASDENGNALPKQKFTAFYTVTKVKLGSFKVLDELGNELSSMSFSALTGEKTPKQGVEVQNDSVSELRGLEATLEGEAAWAFSIEGTYAAFLQPGKSLSLNVAANNSLPAGSYKARLKIAATDESGNYITHKVELEYTAKDKAGILKAGFFQTDGTGPVTSLVFDDLEPNYGLLAGKTMIIRNTGEVDWTQMSIAFQTHSFELNTAAINMAKPLKEGDSVSFKVLPAAGLAPGNYSSTLVLTAKGMVGGKEETITLELPISVKVLGSAGSTTNPTPTPSPTPLPGTDPGGDDWPTPNVPGIIVDNSSTGSNTGSNTGDGSSGTNINANSPNKGPRPKPKPQPKPAYKPKAKPVVMQRTYTYWLPKTGDTTAAGWYMLMMLIAALTAGAVLQHNRRRRMYIPIPMLLLALPAPPEPIPLAGPSAQPQPMYARDKKALAMLAKTSKIVCRTYIQRMIYCKK